MIDTVKDGLTIRKQVSEKKYHFYSNGWICIVPSPHNIVPPNVYHIDEAE